MGKPLAWMFTIAKNLTRNQMRRRQKFSDSEGIDFENDTKFSYVVDPEDRVVLMSAMKILTDEERQILILHSVSGVKHRELAQYLDMPLATVLSKYHRALKKLRNELRGKEDFF
jgi:RNA polymerase sigma-70 factor (ECF subfamily)